LPLYHTDETKGQPPFARSARTNFAEFGRGAGGIRRCQTNPRQLGRKIFTPFNTCRNEPGDQDHGNGNSIKTTTVGSYPIPSWLVAAPSEQALLDATRVVIATQEQAGIDLVCDGELYRFDINHPETNGMIEYFVKPMAGVRTEIGFEELLEYRAQPGMRFRTRPPAVVDAALGQRHPQSAGCLRARQDRGDPAAEIYRHRSAHARQDRSEQALQGHALALHGDCGCAGATGPAYRRRGRAAR
jgi:hypothetical protein